MCFRPGVQFLFACLAIFGEGSALAAGLDCQSLVSSSDLSHVKINEAKDRMARRFQNLKAYLKEIELKDDAVTSVVEHLKAGPPADTYKVMGKMGPRILKIYYRVQPDYQVPRWIAHSALAEIGRATTFLGYLNAGTVAEIIQRFPDRFPEELRKKHGVAALFDYAESVREFRQGGVSRVDRPVVASQLKELKGEMNKLGIEARDFDFFVTPGSRVLVFDTDYYNTIYENADLAFTWQSPKFRDGINFRIDEAIEMVERGEYKLRFGPDL